MENLREIEQHITSSEIFQAWSMENKDAILCSMFRMIGDEEPDAWQLGYYDAATDKVTVFTASIPIIKEGNSTIFRNKERAIERLGLEQVRFGFEDAVLTVERIRSEKYARDLPTRKIIILQQQTTPVWSITYITSTLKILNCKISAKSGELLEESCHSVLSFNEPQKKTT